jgi:broad specificity phosphatase PhoE
MMELILIQHCQSEHHVNNLTGGWTDTPLTDLGRKQAELTALKLKNNLNMDEYVLYSSDLKRAKQTADIIGNNINKDVVEDKRLREINNGVAAWKTKNWAKENRNPQSGNKFDIDYLEFDSGETGRQFYNRIGNCMEEICKVSYKIIVVTHGCALGYIVAWWMNFEPSMLVKAYFSASPGSISKLQQNSYHQNILKVFNDTSHL